MARRALLASSLTLALVSLPPAQARAEDDEPVVLRDEPVELSFLPRLAEREESLPSTRYTWGVFGSQIASVAWELAAVFGALTIKGAVVWKWGTASFRFNPEGYFGTDTGSFGMDKVGHAYSTYVLTELLTDRIRANAEEPDGAPITAAPLAMTVMLYVEMFDGFSVDHGFSYEDLIFDSFGTAFSVLRNTIPGIRNKLDYRMEYVPSGNRSGFHPLTDYSGQKFVLALKLSGFEWLEDTAPSYFELHAGYFARGFTSAERKRGDPERREPYLGVGLDLQHLLFGREQPREEPLVQYGRRAFEYLQLPYTYAAYPQN
ncbi:MAG: DUF2279 domain-containing protein [Deltaproteobacteria bacterium]|jgi:hypothetical protein|nr:DUF2279 domain-containing protein [Deltaproteobacteria bacterium]MBW2533314.1 DUF2279 domain-containing protein [Deltaproteobacteria bacterium]